MNIIIILKNSGGDSVNFSDFFQNKYNKTLALSTDEEIYKGLLLFVKELTDKISENNGKKKLYYVSAEFLVGKMLSNNLINLGIYDEIKELLQKNGKSIEKIEEIENEPSLGNGGLGRLAACFLDSATTLGYSMCGVGINYHFGLFKQVFENNKQTEKPNPWIENDSWLKKTNINYKIDFNNFSLSATMYQMDVTGYRGKLNKLNLFDIDTVDENIVYDGIRFDKGNIQKNLTLFLYPDDSDDNGKKLRIYQEYFLSCCGAHLVVDEAKSKGSNLYDLDKYAVVQINDTHPSLIIPCLLKILEENGIGVLDAINIIGKVCAYTNHTILSEALEKWPIHYISSVCNSIVPYIQKLDSYFKGKYNNGALSIIDNNNVVHMARMDIHSSFSVNGVASLHTEILKNVELNEFYKIYPEKFNNKTNGITFRRWLLHCNDNLSKFISELIGDNYKEDASKLSELLKFLDDKNVLEGLYQIKKENKVKLKNYIKSTKNIDIDENSIFDIQAKRLHEYKRQQLNVLYIIDKYLEIKQGIIPESPVTFIFGAKAAPAYTIAKDIIHLILCLEKVINNDESVNKYIKVVMMENYNVTVAGYLVPACDISEQISLASKEASGTGNMKFMLNGAITLGTEDGANVEIHQLVGDENIYIFGDRSETVVKRYHDGNYRSKDIYDRNFKLKSAVDFITSDIMMGFGDSSCLHRIKNELINKDWFMTFCDFDDYVKTKNRALADYKDKASWQRKMLANIANSGYFSSDRTVEEYNRDIWHLN